MRGYYFCEKCNLFIEVNSFVRYGEMKKRIIIFNCPQCNSVVKEINDKDFIRCSHSLYISVFKTMILKNNRNHRKKILLSLKFI